MKKRETKLLVFFALFSSLTACKFDSIRAPKDHLEYRSLQSYDANDLQLTDIQVIYFPESASPEQIALVNQLGFLLDEYLVDELITADEFAQSITPLLEKARYLNQTQPENFSHFSQINPEKDSEVGEVDEDEDDEDEDEDEVSRQERKTLSLVRDTITLIERWSDLRADNKKIADSFLLKTDELGSYHGEFRAWRGFRLMEPESITARVTFEKEGGILDISVHDKLETYDIHLCRQPYRLARIPKYPVFLIGRINYIGPEGSINGFIRMKGFETGPLYSRINFILRHES